MHRADERFRRVDFEILGNRDAFLRAHIWPRHDWAAPDRLRQGPS